MGSRDIMEFPLENVEIPAAIKLMMQAATKCVELVGHQDLTVDDERLLALSEKLEARVEDEVEKASAIRDEPAEEDGNAPDEVAVEEGDIFVMHGGETLNYKGVVYQKACNSRVLAAGSHGDTPDTWCIKRWYHRGLDHEDMEGNVR
jgi:hypothetical protein